MSQIIHHRLQELAAEEDQTVVAALRRLAVCRGGFTQNAAAALLELDDEAELDHMLTTLRAWQFVAMQSTLAGQPTRYTIDPMIADAVEIDEAAIRAHYDYFAHLARQFSETGDDAAIELELVNIQTAFEQALTTDIAAAFMLYSTCSDFLLAKHYYQHHLDWIQRLADVASRHHSDESLWGAIQNGLGVAYQNAPGGDPRDNLQRAITAYQETLLFHTPTTAQQAYALTQHNLGTAYAALAQLEDRTGNLWNAIDAFEAALKYRTSSEKPRAYAATQHSLGNAYRELASTEERTDNLHRAIHAYQEALTYYTPAQFPQDHAASQNNLGNAYRDLASVENRVPNLHRAIEAYETALNYRTPQQTPEAYAITQNNLGTAYRALAHDEQQVVNLRRAINAFKEALRYHTKAHLDYAATQNNLGSAYRALAEIEDSTENLNLAIQAFEAALQHCTPEIAPLVYATTQANLGLAWQDLSDNAAAVSCWREAARYFQQMGAVDKTELVLEWIARLDDD